MKTARKTVVAGQAEHEGEARYLFGVSRLRSHPACEAPFRCPSRFIPNGRCAGAAPHLTAADSQMPASRHLPPVALHATIKHQPLDRDVPVAIE